MHCWTVRSPLLWSNPNSAALAAFEFLHNVFNLSKVRIAEVKREHIIMYKEHMHHVDANETVM